MDDPIPAGFITLPEALQRIAVHVSEAHLEIAKAELQEVAPSIAAVRQSKESADPASSELAESEAAAAATSCGPSEEAWREWNKRNFAVTKLLVALQTDAIPAMVRNPDSGDLFRLTASDWRFEPFWEQIIRGGVIPLHASRGLEKNPTGAGSATYAQRIVSRPGKKDGLYWPTAPGEEESPLGEFAAQASKEGYAIGGEPVPYHGYYYKILTRQGPMAAGGEVDYVVRGKMIGGFALVAYPAEYGNSGVMTFLVNHSGQVFQKDLGERTTRIAERMTSFNPDQTWKKVDVSELEK
jgi:hypothetical protein